MKIAIHKSKISFSDRWIAYCNEKEIPYKVVNCYDSDIMQQISDCDALMWHFYQANPKDALFAKQLLFSVAASGRKVFPDFATSWHFDDKLGQKYLLEALDAPLVPSYLFYDKNEALGWAEKTSFPKVFKLRGGAGSQNVSLVKSKSCARQLIKKAFSEGFRKYDSKANLKERIRKYKLGKATLVDVIKGIVRLGITTDYAKVAGNEKGYIYFQDFIPGNDHDIRVIVIGDKAFAIKRMVRKDDFRASGSGNILYNKELFDEATIKLSFEIAGRLGTQCLAIDFVYKENIPLIVEVSYGFAAEAYDPCPGFWDRNLHWHEGKFIPQYWMVELMIDGANSKN